MQKIVFVGIILIIGLFSLQYAISDIYTTDVKPEPQQIEIHLIHFQPNIIDVCPADSITSSYSNAIFYEPLSL